MAGQSVQTIKRPREVALYVERLYPAIPRALGTQTFRLSVFVAIKTQHIRGDDAGYSVASIENWAQLTLTGGVTKP